MTNKYSQPEGCCICGTKHSTSQFRPWYDHYSEETYCKVFALPSLQGRRGYVCNPCVLFIKRTVQSMDSNTLHSDPRKRLDMKLKGSRRTKVPDIFPPDSNQVPREMGYVARNMRITPKYVFTGKPYLKLKSREYEFLKKTGVQLLPAREWTDPKHFMENESDAEADLQYYRRITLKKGKKTLQQKKREKLEEEARENQEIFGEAAEKERRERASPPSCPGSEYFSGKIRVPRQINPQNGHQHDRAYGTRANVQKGKVAIHEGSSSPQNDEDGEETDTSDELIDEEDQVSFVGQFAKFSVSPRDVSKPEQFSSCRKRKHAEEREDDMMDFTPAKKKRRCIRTPIKNLKRPTVSFFDCSYWQKFPLCCVTLYAGEGKHCVRQPHENVTTCPRKAACLRKKDLGMLRRLLEKKTPPKKKTRRASSSKARTARAKDVAGYVQKACSKEKQSDSYSSRHNGSYNGSFSDGRIAGFHNDQNGSIENSASASFSDNQSDSFSDNQSEGSSDTHSAISLKVLRLQGPDSASAKFPGEFDLESMLSADGACNYQDELPGLYGDSESESIVSPELQNSSDGASASLQDGIPDSDSGSEKKTRADLESVVSSGDEEPNENRMTCTGSPLIEKPCKFF